MVQSSVDRHTHEHQHVMCIKSISWTAVIAGAFVGVGLSFLLNLFSIAIGLSVYSTTPEGVTSTAVGGFVGALIGGIISMFVAGWVSGYLARPFCERRHLGILYGFITWSLALIITAILAAHVGQYVAAYTKFISDPRDQVIVTSNQEAPAAPAVSQTASGDTVVNADKAATAISISAFIVFVLFFIGAVSACFGAHYGMICQDKEWDERRRV